MSLEDLENMKGVNLPKVSQIGIVVLDIGKAVRYYLKFLNSFRTRSTRAAPGWRGSGGR